MSKVIIRSSSLDLQWIARFIPAPILLWICSYTLCDLRRRPLPVIMGVIIRLILRQFFFGRCYTLAVSDDKMYRNDLIFTENRGIMIIVDLGNRVCWCKFYPNLLSSNSHQGQSHRTRLIFCWIRRWWISSLS